MLSDKEKQIIESIEKDRESIINVAKELIQIPSLTGDEGPAQKYVAEKLDKLEMKLDIWEPDVKELFDKYPEIAQYPSRWEAEYDMPIKFKDKCEYDEIEKQGYKDILNYKNRPNVVGTIKGTGGGKSLIINGHIDCVTLGDESDWKYKPFGAEIVEGMMYGRGTSDMKCGIAAAIKAIEHLKKNGFTFKGDLIFQSVVNEEHAGNGTLACIARGYTADAAVMAEPTNSELVSNGSKGGIYWEITVKGKETHTAMRWHNNEAYGVSAIEKAAIVINELISMESEINKDKYLLNLGIGMISGGTYATSTALNCSFSGVAYFKPELGLAVPGLKNMKALLKDAVEKANSKDPWLKENPAQLFFQHYDDSSLIDENEDIVKLFQEVGKDSLGKDFKAITKGANDARHMVNQGNIPSITFGPGFTGNAHKVDEFVSLEKIMDAVKVFAVAISRWCG